MDDVRDQVAIGYVDDKQRKHTFDLVAHLKNDRKTAFAVKPSKRVASSGIAETINLIRAQAPKGFADDFVVRTGEHITRIRADNARLIHRARRTRCEDDISAIAKVVATMRGATSINSVLAASINNGHGFYAVVCLIDDCVLEHVGPRRITYSSLVRPLQMSKESR